MHYERHPSPFLRKGGSPNENPKRTLRMTILMSLQSATRRPHSTSQHFDLHEATRLTWNEAKGGRNSTEGGGTSLDIEFPISQTDLLHNLKNSFGKFESVI